MLREASGALALGALATGMPAEAAGSLQAEGTAINVALPPGTSPLPALPAASESLRPSTEPSGDGARRVSRGAGVSFSESESESEDSDELDESEDSSTARVRW